MGISSDLLAQLKQASLLQYYLLCHIYKCISLIKRDTAARHLHWLIHDAFIYMMQSNSELPHMVLHLNIKHLVAQREMFHTD